MRCDDFIVDDRNCPKMRYNKTKGFFNKRRNLFLFMIVVVIGLMAIISFNQSLYKHAFRIIKVEDKVKDTKQPIILAVHSYNSPIELARNYQPLIDYLTEKVGRPFALSISKTYEEHIEQIGSDRVDLAYMGPAAYVIMVERFGAKRLLSNISTNEKHEFGGYIITRSDNPAECIADLKDKSFASSSLISTMSYIIPRYMFIEAGVRFPKEHLKVVGSNSNVCLNILSGNINAGAVCENTYAVYKDKGLKVIAVSPPSPEHLFVSANSLDDELNNRIQEALLNITKTEVVNKILKPIHAKIIKMVSANDIDYNSLRSIIVKVRADEMNFKEEKEEML